MRGYDYANNNILCINGILFFLHLVSSKRVVIILVTVSAPASATTVVSNTRYY